VELVPKAQGHLNRPIVPLPRDSQFEANQTPERTTSNVRTLNPLNWPETNLAFFAFLLHFPWELLQMPFYSPPPHFSTRDVILNCTLATAGDAALSVAAFWGAATVAGGRSWVLQPQSRSATASFIAIGLIVTLIVEILATGPWQLWQYSELMPAVPGFGVGLLPLLQWIILPLMLVAIVRRQLLGAGLH
jgi:hypothetical protein